MDHKCIEDALTAHELSGKEKLRPYQLEGVQWLIDGYKNRRGGILADEMGLGKTCQTIAFLVMVTAKGATHSAVQPKGRHPHLVLCPLSVISGWQSEFRKFAPNSVITTYLGNKEERARLQLELGSATIATDVVLTTYELCLRDSEYLGQLVWDIVVVDEGHRLKNSESLLYKAVVEFKAQCRVILTGTPIQNNLAEMYSLLSFVCPSKFALGKKDQFVSMYADTMSNREVAAKLQDLVRPYMLRRTKAVVAVDIPSKQELVVYHGMTVLQKKYYKAILMRDYDAFQTENKTRLLNVLIQLRKCINHPYLFDGVEPEPFESGEHLVTASGKLLALDALLQRLRIDGHRVLLFSQMTRMLDILQDYLTLRGYKYERLDGSVRGEERFTAVRNFNEKDDTFVFLLSSRAGGQGLNLATADTVVFYDSDFNPQVDLQAAARSHRIGQTRPVKVLRLVARNTVDEVVVQRANSKLKLTRAVMDSDVAAAAAASVALTAACGNELRRVLKLGLDKLFGEVDEDDDSCNVDTALGESKDGRWVDNIAASAAAEHDTSEADESTIKSIYEFEGKDYSGPASAADVMFDKLVSEQIDSIQLEGRTLRSDQEGLRSSPPAISRGVVPAGRSRPSLTEAELEERREKRAEAAARRTAAEAEAARRRADERQRRLQRLWEENHYASCKVESGDDESVGEKEPAEFTTEDEDLSEAGAEEQGAAITRTQEEEPSINYVSGDVTKPVLRGRSEHALVVHCVDDAGHWGRGGVFDAVTALSSLPATQYELAAQMKDLALGDVHLVAIRASCSADLTGALVLSEPPAAPSVRSSAAATLEASPASPFAALPLPPTPSTAPLSVPSISVALVVAQHRSRSGHLSGIQLDALEAALRKIRREALRQRCETSVHLPRIGYNTPDFNWYRTERLIRKILVTEGGLRTYVYYFPRGRRHHGKRRHSGDVNISAAACSTAAEADLVDATAAKRAGSATKDDSEPISCGASKGKDGARHTLSQGARAELPSDAFEDVSVAFDASVFNEARQRLHRLIVSHGGEAHDKVQENTAYIVADASCASAIERLRDLTTPALSFKWIDDSVAAGELVDITSYLLL